MNEKPEKPSNETNLLSSEKRFPQRTPPITDRAPTPAGAAPWRLLLQVGEQDQTKVGLEIKDEVLLGRSDPITSYYPDLDLTPYGARELGVSRRHLVIRQLNGQLFIEDIGSANGTLINGQGVPPNQDIPLKDGDKLKLGELTIIVRFARTPA